MMKKWVCCLLAGLIAVGGLLCVGCGDSGDAVTLRILHYRPEDQDFFDWFNEEFMNRYSNVTVEYDAVNTKNYSTILNARMAAAESNPTEIDIFGIQSGSLVSEESVNRLLDISGYETLWEGIPEYIREANSIDGKSMILPLSVNKELVIYNKTMFEELGLEVPKTWSAFVQLCDTIQGKIGTQYSMNGTDTFIKSTIFFGGLENWPISMVMDAVEATTIRQQNPAIYHDIVDRETDFNDPLFLEMFEKIEKITTYFQPYSTGFTYDLAPGEFSKGNYAMMIDGDWSLASIRYSEPEFEVGTFVLPGSENEADNQYAATKLGGSALGVYRNSTKVEWAVKYLEMLMSDEIYPTFLEMCKVGSVKEKFSGGDPALADVEDSIAVIPFSSYSCNTSYNLRFSETLSPELILKEKSAEDIFNELYSYMSTTDWRAAESCRQWLRMYPRPTEE